MSRIPPFMNDHTLRKLLEQRFQIKRIYLQAEADHATRARRKAGGNHKTKYIEGWVEFVLKEDAKMAALVLNNT